MLSPGTRKKSGKIIFSSTISTPLGNMLACAADSGICLLVFEDRKGVKQQVKKLQSNLNQEIQTGDHHYLEILRQQLDEYFSHKRKRFDVPVYLSGTSFQESVWKLLMKIPFGNTVSYSRLAADMGSSAKTRAVASANGANKLAIIIPCHRVVGSNGSLTGYAGGLWRKAWLLDHERGQSTIKFET